jgi:hypothetical protein
MIFHPKGDRKVLENDVIGKVFGRPRKEVEENWSSEEYW